MDMIFNVAEGIALRLLSETERRFHCGPNLVQSSNRRILPQDAYNESEHHAAGLIRHHFGGPNRRKWRSCETVAGGCQFG